MSNIKYNENKIIINQNSKAYFRYEPKTENKIMNDKSLRSTQSQNNFKMDAKVYKKYLLYNIARTHKCLLIYCRVTEQK